jgi:hypothetical protein
LLSRFPLLREKRIERKEGRQYKYNLALRRFLATSVAVEKQKILLS